MDAKNIFRNKIKRIKSLLTALTEASNDLNVLCDLNGSRDQQKHDAITDTNSKRKCEFEHSGGSISYLSSDQLGSGSIVALNCSPIHLNRKHICEDNLGLLSPSAFKETGFTCSNAKFIVEETDQINVPFVSEVHNDEDVELVVDDYIDVGDAGDEIGSNSVQFDFGACCDEDIEIIVDVEEPINENNSKLVFSSTNNDDLPTTARQPTKSKHKPFAHHEAKLSANLNSARPKPDVNGKTNGMNRHQGCDIMKMSVPISDGTPKKLCCMFCRKQYQNLERHLRTVHRNEVAVKNFVVFPPGTKNRRDQIAKIRKRGEFIWNSDFKLNRGVLQTSRRSNKKFARSPWQLVACANCMGSYSTNTLRHHWRNCTGDSIIGERVVKQLGRALEGRVHPAASDDLNQVFSKFRDNESTRLIKFDWLAIVHGNELCLNYSPHYQEGYICSKLRAAAKLLHLSKSLSDDISDLSSLFNVKHCDTVVEVIRQMGKFDRKSKSFGSPGTALTTVTLINTIGELLITESMKLNDDQMEKNAERFLRVFKRDVRTKINKLVTITIRKNRRNKKLNIPTTADIKKLAQFLDIEREDCYRQLNENFSYQKWLSLSQLTLVSILVFNRRRAGEMRNILISDFNEREIVANQSDMILETISQQKNEEIKSRMEIRGKLDVTVPVLLKDRWEKCIELLIHHRRTAGLEESNEFLFALPTQSYKVRTVNVWAAINSYAKACGAENPSSLKGTNLRKHLASYCATKDLRDVHVTNMAAFMGHREQVHLKIYRHNPLVSQVSQIAPLLNFAQGKDDNSLSHTRKSRNVQKGMGQICSKNAVKKGPNNAVKKGSKNAVKKGPNNAVKKGPNNAVKKGPNNAVKKGSKNAVKKGSTNAVEKGPKRLNNQDRTIAKTPPTATSNRSYTKIPAVQGKRKKKTSAAPKLSKKAKLRA